MLTSPRSSILNLLVSATLTLAVTQVLPVALLAQSLVFSNFSTTTGLQLNSVTMRTTSADGPVVRLVSGSNDVGSMFTTTARNVASGFSTAFSFRLSDRGGSYDGIAVGADGLVFVVQQVGPTALGSAGEYLGYGSAGSNKIVTSLGVEFDTYKNTSATNDPSSNHIGINLNGTITSVATANISPDFDSTGTGTKWTSWIDYNGSTLEVRVSNSGTRPISANLAYAITSSAFQTTLGSNTSAFIGFTAATGGAFAKHDIVNWTFSESYIPGGVIPGSAIPEPADFALLASAAALAAMAFRRHRAKSHAKS
jgi:Legume lectin domain